MAKSNRCSIFLIGYRGTGKTTAGRALAQLLGWEFRDADAELEAAAGMTIAEIFVAEGEPGFRDRESRTLAELSAGSNRVIATGGGVILRPQNSEILRATGFVAWLTASPEELWDRIHADTTTAARRPNLTASGGLDEVVRLLAIREPLYREVADVSVATEGKSPEAVAADILQAWESRAIPDPPATQ